MHTKEADQLLKQSNLRQTDCRREVICVFLSRQHAVSQPELEQALHKFDRVTLYRTLNTFLTKGIIHKVLDDTGSTKYALCTGECTEHHHEDEHVHFKCLKCENIVCIEAVSVPAISLPTGFTYVDASLLVRGICNLCQGNNES
ncbi:MAG TPA: transcriptional repressor [Chitinophagales bacterium]|nr:transcriptional repressor [Chitinophagales bacterium]HRK28107.1 transcriptional repressor [Chitinophagales bacterium]